MTSTPTTAIAGSAASIAAASAATTTSSAAHASRETMTAVVQDRYGTAEVLDVRTVARPEPGTGQVLLAVRAAGVDRGTEHLMTGLPLLIRVLGYGFRGPKQPVPGLDVAGTVVALGPGVDRFAVGDEVFGIADGSFAEFAVATAEKLSHRPPSVAVEAAAVSAVSGGTALQAVERAGVSAGDRVLVLGASGGVGSFATQLAVRAGAEVHGVAGSSNQAFVRSLGVHAVHDHTTTSLDDIDRRFDVIIDTGGRNPLRALRRRLAPGGTLVIVGGEGGGRVTGGIGRQLRALCWSPFVAETLTTFVADEHHRWFDQLAELLASGAIRARIGHREPLTRAAAAVARLGDGRPGGKIVLEVARD